MYIYLWTRQRYLKNSKSFELSVPEGIICIMLTILITVHQAHITPFHTPSLHLTILLQLGINLTYCKADDSIVTRSRSPIYKIQVRVVGDMAAISDHHGPLQSGVLLLHACCCPSPQLALNISFAFRRPPILSGLHRWPSSSSPGLGLLPAQTFIH